MSRRSTTLASKFRARRQNREFDLAVRSASPAMQQELIAAAARQNYTR